MGSQSQRDHDASDPWHVLRLLARITLPTHDYETIAGSIARYLGEKEQRSQRWRALIATAERHGLGPLLASHLTTLGIEPPAEMRHQLLSLVVRHRRANAARHQATVDIIRSFNDSGIKSVLLKGAALVNTVYPQRSLRPMSDIDILVAPANARDAQRSLLTLGFSAEDAKTGYLTDHHHLPMASKVVDNIAVNIEVHHDALSGDVESSITFDNLSTPLQAFELDGQRTHALGAVDTLRHLCQHMLEPIAEIKLGAIADLYGYALAYRDDIDFDRLDRCYPFVRNTFRLLHYITPLPEALTGWADPSDHSAPRGTGYGYPPMTTTLGNTDGAILRFRRLFSAPDWWLHAFYNVPPEASILPARIVRHPAQVLRWLTRRARARWVSKPR